MNTDPATKLFSFINKPLIAVSAISIVLISGCAKQDAPSNAIRPALAYKISAGSGLATDVYAGEIRSRVEADHAFRVGGKISQRLVDAGALVKKGQPLAHLDPQDTKLAADSARANSSAAETEANFAEAEMKRFTDLFNKGFVSQSALDQKINLANAAKARLDSARAQANVSLNQAGYATLVAETNGVVTQVMAEAGQVVAQGQVVMKVADPREKELSISVPEAKLGEFRQKNEPARALRVGLWSHPDKYYNAVIREIGGAADPVTRTYPVRLSLRDADDVIQLGMTAYAVFVGANDVDTLAVPLSALYVKDKTTGVWQIDTAGKVSLKPVTVLAYRETSALIKAAGIKVGDTIVAAGVHKLRDGELVKPIIDPVVTGDGKVAYASTAPAAAADAEKKQEVAFLKRWFN